MLIPVVPFVKNTNVVNKNILYSDTVLSPKDFDSDIMLTSIINVEENSLEDCLKEIFKANSNVTFNTIQYSKNDKKVYFYTNSNIFTKEWESSEVKFYKPLTSSTQVLEEVKRILASEKNKDNDCISLYDVAMLFRKAKSDYDKIRDNYTDRCEDLLASKFNDSRIVIYSFDYENNELRIGFNYINENFDKINFSKKNGDLYISKSESFYDKEVFAILDSELSKLYDELLKYSAFMSEYNFRFKAVNSNFLVDISRWGVSICAKSLNNPQAIDFELSSLSTFDDYDYQCNSIIVMNALKGKEDEIFKRIFVKISDCPNWCQAALYEMRQNQLAEEQKIEVERIYKEVKRERRLELARKIFPFIKK